MYVLSWGSLVKMREHHILACIVCLARVYEYVSLSWFQLGTLQYAETDVQETLALQER